MDGRNSRWTGRVRRSAWLVAGCVVIATAQGGEILPTHRLRRHSPEERPAVTPVNSTDGLEDCGPELPGVREVMGPDFDPARFDELAVAGQGRLVAYVQATFDPITQSLGAKGLVVLREGRTEVSVSGGSGDDDQASIQLDPFGWRMAFRGSTDVGDPEAASDVYLHSATLRGDAAEGTRNVTNVGGAGYRAFAPSLAARTRLRGVGGGYDVRERDARVAFVSDADLDTIGLARNPDEGGPNVDEFQQLFLWSERGNSFRQLTKNDEDAEIHRPSLNGRGSVIAFESTGDLTPNAADPRDPDRIGNPFGVRQIFVWRDGPQRGRIKQITFGDFDSFAPRLTATGRYVFFCSAGDLIPGKNADGNFEIFRYRRRGPPARRLRQLTDTTVGDSVLPRPTRSGTKVTFYSTVLPQSAGTRFGDDGRQCGPSAMHWGAGRVRLIHGVTDVENAARAIAGAPVIVVGPPAPGASAAKIHFVTNDPSYLPEEPLLPAGFAFFVVRATRFSRN